MADLCTMCEERPATTTWGFPVCQSCADGLTALDADLKAMEAEDPALAEAGRKVEESVRAWLAEAPPYCPVTDGLAVLRRIGSGKSHLAAVDPLWFEVTKWIGPAYWGLHQPAVALCRAVLRPDHRGLVAMKPGTKVGCETCRRLSGRDIRGITEDRGTDG